MPIRCVATSHAGTVATVIFDDQGTGPPRTLSVTQTMQAILSALSLEESRAVYNALAQWADNSRNGLEEGAGEELTAEEVNTVPLVEAVVARLELVIYGESPEAPVEAPKPTEPGVLTAGTYILKADVINPKPDRRRSSSWTSMETVLAGAKFHVSEHPISRDETILLMRLHRHNGEASPKQPVFQAIVPHLVRIEETPSDYLRRESSTLTADKILDQLVKDGLITLDQFHAANAAFIASLK